MKGKILEGENAPVKLNNTEQLIIELMRNYLIANRLY